jgi:hypothetical protein
MIPEEEKEGDKLLLILLQIAIQILVHTCESIPPATALREQICISNYFSLIAKLKVTALWLRSWVPGRHILPETGYRANVFAVFLNHSRKIRDNTSPQVKPLLLISIPLSKLLFTYSRLYVPSLSYWCVTK